LKARKFGAVGVTKDGRHLIPNGGSSIYGTISVETFPFPVSLDEVAVFLVGTRPIRTQEWKDVLLVKREPASADAPKPN
jgi:hypothetical protein